MTDYKSASGVIYTVTQRTVTTGGSVPTTYTVNDVVIKSPTGQQIAPAPPASVITIRPGTDGSVITGTQDYNSFVSVGGRNYVSVPGSTGNFNLSSSVATANTFYIGGDTSISDLLSLARGSTINVVGGQAKLSGSSGAVGALSGNNINISYGGTFDTGSSVASVLTGSSITFGEGGGTLVLNGGGSAIDLLGSNSSTGIGLTSINNYDPSKDVIMLQNTATAIRFYRIDNRGTTQKTITVFGTGGTIIARYVVTPASGVTLNTGDYIPGNPNNPIKITYNDGSIYIGACFLAGTMILTSDGLVAVEDIQIGDQVITFDWQNNINVVQPVIWVGKSHVEIIANLPDDSSGYPVRVLKDAISEGVPYKDMLVTAEHCLFFEGKFVPVRMLVNGISIFYDKTITSYDYYHVETEKHSVITADGMLTESFLDTGHILFKREQIAPKSWEVDGCAPLCVERNFVESVYNAIKGRAQEKSFPTQYCYDSVEKTTDHGVYATVTGNRELSIIRSTENYIIFRLPPNVHTVTLYSNVGRPCDSIGPFIDDRRNLGILVGEVAVLDGATFKNINTHLTEKDLAGWHGIEHPELRWTKGAAELTLTPIANNKISALKISIVAGGPYILKDVEQDYLDLAVC